MASGAIGFSQHIPATGKVAPRLAAFDDYARGLLDRFRLPGVSLAVSRNGKLIYARGFGYANRERNEAVEPRSLFRIASISKPLTAVMVMKLVESGRLSLEAKAFDLLPEFMAGPPHGVEARNRLVTVRQLLHHTGGWDRSRMGSFDPMFRSLLAAEETGEPAPASCRTVIRSMMTKPMQFDPGTQYAYSNYGYCILGRIIEKVTGKTYEQAVKDEVLSTAGITQMRIGKTLPAGRAKDEVTYYHPNAEARVASVFPGLGFVPPQYGGWYLEAMDSHGGWIASARDLVRFADALNGRGGKRLLSEASMRELTARPAPPVSQQSASWYGLGFLVRPAGGGFNLWHNGSLDGTITLLVRAANGYSWAVLTNTRPADGRIAGEMDAGAWQALEKSGGAGRNRTDE